MPKFQTQKIPTSYRVHRRHLNLKQAQSISLREETNIPIRFVKNQLLFTPFSIHYRTRPRCQIIYCKLHLFRSWSIITKFGVYVRRDQERRLLAFVALRARLSLKYSSTELLLIAKAGLFVPRISLLRYLREWRISLFPHDLSIRTPSHDSTATLVGFSLFFLT